MDKVIALGRPTFGDEELNAVRDVLESGWVAGQGPNAGVLEERFAELCGTRHAVAVANCTAALHLALLAFEVGPGDDVLVADYTFPATGHSVLYTGARPVFVDVQPGTGLIDLADIAAAMTPATKGIIAVDVYGQCADYDELRSFASEQGVFIIEDAAPAVGATYRGRPAGSLADVACFSLHGRKGITSGEGGLFVTDDQRLAEKVRKLSAFGIESAYTRQAAASLAVPVFDELGYNYKLSEIAVAIAIVQLERLPELLAKRRRLVALYADLLGGIQGITLPVALPDRESTWQTYCVAIDPELDRGRIAMGLRKREIQSNFGTYSSHVQPLYGLTRYCPVSADIFARHLAIPMHANLNTDDLERVAEAVAETVAEERARVLESTP